MTSLSSFRPVSNPGTKPDPACSGLTTLAADAIRSTALRCAMMRERTSVDLVFFGFGRDPAAVTDLVGLQPSVSQTEGEVSALGESWVATNSFWSLKAPSFKDEAQNAELVALVDQLESRSDGVRRAAESFEGVIRVSITSESPFSGYGVDPGILSRIAALGLRLGIGFMVWGADE